MKFSVMKKHLFLIVMAMGFALASNAQVPLQGDTVILKAQYIGTDIQITVDQDALLDSLEVLSAVEGRTIGESTSSILALYDSLQRISACGKTQMDGYTYDVVLIGDQCWFAENLQTTLFADGSAISDEHTWTGLTTAARCDWQNTASNAATYGRFYNWYAVDAAQGLCPSGWHVPTDQDWTDLESYLTSEGFTGTEGTALKFTSGWDSGGNGTDDYGFSAQPVGYRWANNGNFLGNGDRIYMWSSTENGGNANARLFEASQAGINSTDYDKNEGFSVRCLKD
jgi:uncharacterized protein (TIGR02145 family)